MLRFADIGEMRKQSFQEDDIAMKTNKCTGYNTPIRPAVRRPSGYLVFHEMYRKTGHYRGWTRTLQLILLRPRSGNNDSRGIDSCFRLDEGPSVLPVRNEMYLSDVDVV